LLFLLQRFVGPVSVPASFPPPHTFPVSEQLRQMPTASVPQTTHCWFSAQLSSDVHPTLHAPKETSQYWAVGQMFPVACRHFVSPVRPAFPHVPPPLEPPSEPPLLEPLPEELLHPIARTIANVQDNAYPVRIRNTPFRRRV
jgi:hypothetical protein